MPQSEGCSIFKPVPDGGFIEKPKHVVLSGQYKMLSVNVDVIEGHCVYLLWCSSSCTCW